MPDGWGTVEGLANTCFTENENELPVGRRCGILSLNTKCRMSVNRETRDFVIFYLTGELDACGNKSLSRASQSNLVGPRTRVG